MSSGLLMSETWQEREAAFPFFWQSAVAVKSGGMRLIARPIGSHSQRRGGCSLCEPRWRSESVMLASVLVPSSLCELL